MTSLSKFVSFCIVVWLMNGCATVYDTKVNSARSQGLYIDTVHDGKDVVMHTSYLTSEEHKLSLLKASAQIKASQICPGTTYKLINIHLTPVNFVARSGMSTAGAISANIQCDEVIKDISTASTSRDKNTVTNLPACQGSDISRWTNCFGTITMGNGSKYVGEFRNGMYHGQGTYTNAIAWKYVGEFMDNKRHGQGILYEANGKINAQGIWANNEFLPNVPFIANGSLIQQGSKVEDNKDPLAMFLQAVKLDEERKAQKSFSDLFSAIDGTKKEYEQQEKAKIKQAEQEQLRLSQNQPPALSISPPVTAPFMGKRLALVIGNASYKVRPLLNPRNDADDVSRVLRSTGFEVIDLRDATLAQMRTSVRQFGERLLSNDVGLVYYAGHGIEVRGRNYFIPVNADIKATDEVADQALDVSLILAKMDTAKKGVNILIVDACRDDPFGRSFRSNSRGLATMDAPQGTLIAYATAPGNVAIDGTGRNSPFTKHLVRAMQVPNTPIELMFKEVRRAVREETKNQQTPWENSSLIGNFYFSVKK